MASTRGRQVVVLLTNKSGGSVAAGDVVVLDSSNDTAFTTTTTARAEVSVGIAQETIASNATGRVLVSGYASLVNVPASVTRGHYVETHTVAKQATGNSTRRSGSFGTFLTGGTSPSALIWGDADQTASGGGSSGALIFLEAHTASSSASLSFTSFISSTYDDYLIELVNIIPATNNVSLKLNLSSNGGSSYDTSSNYYSAVGYILNSGTAGGATTGNPTTSFILGDGLSNSSSRGVQGTLHLLSPGSTALDKPLFGHLQYTNQANVVGATYSGLLTVAATAYNAAQFAMSSGNIASGTIRIYGLTKS